MIDTTVAVYHDAAPEDGHRCEARVSATCSACRRAYAICTTTDDAIGQMLRRSWICRDCRSTACGAVSPDAEGMAAAGVAMAPCSETAPHPVHVYLVEAQP